MTPYFLTIIVNNIMRLLDPSIIQVPPGLIARINNVINNGTGIPDFQTNYGPFAFASFLASLNSEASPSLGERIRQSLSIQITLTTHDIIDNNTNTFPDIGIHAKRIKEMHLEEEVPEAYLCSLTQEIMTNPVRDKNQPNYVFEKAAILKALEMRAVNPYTNTPLAIENLVDDMGLKTEIEKYIERAEEMHGLLTTAYRF